MSILAQVSPTKDLSIADALVLAELYAEICRYESALELIAAPVRADGTYNRDRAACQRLAYEALYPTKVTTQS